MHDIFYFTDVHGYYDLYKAVMDYCHEQDPEAMIIFGGDACDRGPDGYQIMRELLDNPQVVYLKGNHEDIFVQAAKFIVNDYIGALDEMSIKEYIYSLIFEDNIIPQVYLSIYNGGFATLVTWMLDGMPEDFIYQIDKLPLTFSTDTMDFCHAGTIPKVFDRVAKNEYNDELPDNDDIKLILWDRNMLGYGWKENRMCVYGHTPVYLLASKYYGKDKSASNAHPCKYTSNLNEQLSGAKIAMDMGVVNNGRIFVLNCLTLKAQGFEMKNGQTKKIELIQL